MVLGCYGVVIFGVGKLVGGVCFGFVVKVFVVECYDFYVNVGCLFYCQCLLLFVVLFEDVQ